MTSRWHQEMLWVTSSKRVSPEASFSDHRHIRFTLPADRPEPVYRRNPRATDWSVFEHGLAKRLEGSPTNIHSTIGIERSVSELNAALIRSYHEACPERRQRTGKVNPWWTPELGKLRKKARASFRRAGQLGTPDSWNSYRQACRLFKKEVRHAKRVTWMSYCEGVENAHSASRLHRILTRDPLGQVGML